MCYVATLVAERSFVDLQGITVIRLTVIGHFLQSQAPTGGPEYTGDLLQYSLS